MDGGNSMADMGTKAAAEKWGVSQKAVEAWCRRISKTDSRITQDKPRCPWHIPVDYPNPFSK